MASAEERAAVGTLLAGWTATPIKWPNRDFTPPASGEWIAVTLKQGEAFQLEIGADQVIHRHPGTLFIQVFTRANTGDKRAFSLADSLGVLFRRSRYSFSNGEVVFRTPAVHVVGVDGAYFQLNVTVPYYRDTLY